LPAGSKATLDITGTFSSSPGFVTRRVFAGESVVGSIDISEATATELSKTQTTPTKGIGIFDMFPTQKICSKKPLPAQATPVAYRATIPLLVIGRTTTQAYAKFEQDSE
jgi:hypothetical protein